MIMGYYPIGPIITTAAAVKIITSLSIRKQQSECSSVACVISTELYGSTIVGEICGAGYIANCKK